MNKEELKMTNKELEMRVKALEERLARMECRGEEAVLTISDINVGERFVYAGYNYTKLNEDNYCIIDDCDESFMRCIFDPITNDYRESIIRGYINSDRFIERLGVNIEHLRPHYDEDLITLPSREEYEKYRDLIRGCDSRWATRSACSDNTSGFYIVNCIGCIVDAYFNYISGTRIAFELAPNTPVDRKVNKEED